MTDWAINHHDVKVAHGNAVDQLATMPDRSVQCIVTSPPFWALRDYGTGRWVGGDESCDHSAAAVLRTAPPGTAKQASNVGASAVTSYTDSCPTCGAERHDEQIGLEDTPEDWCDALVAVFRECRRVLRDDGVLWLEVGDTYNANQGSGFKINAYNHGEGATDSAAIPGTPARPLTNVKPKDLVGAPWLLAFALRADGWYLRSDVIWHRPNPMPESVTDRPTKAHSYVFLLTKSARYYYDADAIAEDSDRGGEFVKAGAKSLSLGTANAQGVEPSGNAARGGMVSPARRNARTVWTIPPEPLKIAHFATFPQALVERCIMAGSSEHGGCSICGTPWRRVIEREATGRVYTGGRAEVDEFQTRGYAQGAELVSRTVGWEPTCEHVDALPEPQLILDPFMGSGTTALVARRLGRHARGTELNPDYLAIAAKRLQQLSLF